MPSEVDYQIEDDVPFPGRPRVYAGRKPTYPFNQLQVGQSFFVPSKHLNFSNEKKLCQALHKARETTGYNFTWAREPGGFRIFRLEGEAVVKKRKVA